MGYHYSYIAAKKYYRSEKLRIIQSLENFFLDYGLIKIKERTYVENPLHFFQSLEIFDKYFMYYENGPGKLNYLKCPKCNQDILQNFEPFIKQLESINIVKCPMCEGWISPNEIIQEDDDYEVIKFIFTDLVIKIKEPSGDLGDGFVNGISQIFDAPVDFLN